jgi:hypothetical protein
VDEVADAGARSKWSIYSSLWHVFDFEEAGTEGVGVVFTCTRWEFL